MVGTWTLTGRALGANADNITGQVAISWLPGGYFMEQRGQIVMMGFEAHILEILGYDPVTDTFPSTVFSSMGGDPGAFGWDVQGDVVTHWTKGSKYTGRFSADGTMLVGGWRPDEGVEQNAGNTYDATMIRLK